MSAHGKGTDSASFGSSLRRGFQPTVAKPKRTKPKDKLPSIEKGKIPSLVLGNDVSESSWKELDAKVNQYPGMRTFTAIGTGGDDFAAAMVSAISVVVGDVPHDQVTSRPSSGGRYVSVRITACVSNPDEVCQIFVNMKNDVRLKWLI